MIYSSSGVQMCQKINCADYMIINLQSTSLSAQTLGTMTEILGAACTLHDIKNMHNLKYYQLKLHKLVATTLQLSSVYKKIKTMKMTVKMTRHQRHYVSV